VFPADGLHKGQRSLLTLTKSGKWGGKESLSADRHEKKKELNPEVVKQKNTDLLRQGKRKYAFGEKDISRSACTKEDGKGTITDFSSALLTLRPSEEGGAQLSTVKKKEREGKGVSRLAL